MDIKVGQATTVNGEYWLTQHTEFGSFYSIKHLLNRAESLGYNRLVLNRIDVFTYENKQWSVV
jgi:hypothetical protein